MIEALISSKTRIKVLLKFFLNSTTTSHLRGLEGEFGDSTNSIRVELNKFEKAGLLSSFAKGNKKLFQANTEHPLYDEIHNIILKYVGIDRIITNVAKRLGEVDSVYLVGKFARGLDSNIIDLIFVGDVDRDYLVKLIGKVEELIGRKVRYLVYDKTEFKELRVDDFETPPLLLWKNDY
jgi:predicted nucleotidyltransferase